MSIKDQIAQIIDRLPEDVLSNLLEYLKQIEDSPKNSISLSMVLQDIMQEDEDLLKELAK